MRDDHDAGKAQAAAVRDRARLRRDQQRAILVEARGRHLVDQPGRIRREAHQIAVAAEDHLADTGVTRELRMLGKMQRLAMHRESRCAGAPI